MILASNSPRRQQLLREAGFKFEIYTDQVDETYPPSTPALQVGAYLARKKNDFYQAQIADSIILTADTTVVLDNQLLEKPADESEAMAMLKKLSARRHEVITGVCISFGEAVETFSVSTQVVFRRLTEEEIGFYVSNYQPMDKAGAYGIQEWIGMVGIPRIEGSYFNVMGMPVQEVYASLERFRA